MQKQWGWIIIGLASLLSSNGSAQSAAELLIRGDDVVVYSGPSSKYRPLTTLEKGQKVPVSLQKVAAVKEPGEYYKILILLKPENKKRVGYVSVSGPVQFQRSEVDEKVDSYEELLLTKAAVQFAFAALTDKNYQWSVGYLHYPLTNVYLKGFAGQILGLTQGSLLVGGEIGLDHFIRGSWSAYLTFGTGAVFPATSSSPFAGSSSPSQFLQSGAGLRYSAGEHAAVSLGYIVSSYFNSNNSILLNGVNLTLEVGL